MIEICCIQRDLPYIIVTGILQAKIVLVCKLIQSNSIFSSRHFTSIYLIFSINFSKHSPTKCVTLDAYLKYNLDIILYFNDFVFELHFTNYTIEVVNKRLRK